LIPWKTPKDFEFFENSHPPIQADMLVQGLANRPALAQMKAENVKGQGWRLKKG
jgi:hypothetical protein